MESTCKTLCVFVWAYRRNPNFPQIPGNLQLRMRAHIASASSPKPNTERQPHAHCPQESLPASWTRQGMLPSYSGRCCCSSPPGALGPRCLSCGTPKSLLVAVVSTAPPGKVGSCCLMVPHITALLSRLLHYKQCPTGQCNFLVLALGQQHPQRGEHLPGQCPAAWWEERLLTLSHCHWFIGLQLVASGYWTRRHI